MKTSRSGVITKAATGLTLQEARKARVDAWKFVFDCARKKAAAHAPNNGPDDAMKGSKHDRANPDYT